MTEPRAPRWPGKPYPLGAQFDGYGTNFAVFSGIAERVELCLFDGGGERYQAGATIRVIGRSLWLLRRDP